MRRIEYLNEIERGCTDSEQCRESGQELIGFMQQGLQGWEIVVERRNRLADAWIELQIPWL